uniref:Transforming acidic coiled-coil-containing protein C-terminal domain-containing protein n=1 Tax=Ascaris lumbricoides TaxID=6252 RepID=A0A9J2Q231_ASCLU
MAVSGGVNVDEFTATGNMARRRVSFSAMRTIQEFDQDRNAVTSPHDEPLKLGDTGSSDGLGSAQVSHTEYQDVNTTINASVIHNGGFFPKMASTPMPHYASNIAQGAGDESNVTALSDFTANVFRQNSRPQTENGDDLSEAPMDISGATLTTTDLRNAIASEQLSSSANDITLANNTRALFTGMPLNNGGNLNCFPKEMSISSSTTRLESTLEPTATMALFAPANGNDFVEEETEDVFKDINNGEVIDEPAPVQSICGEETFLLTDAGMSFVNESRDFTFESIAAEQLQKEVLTPHESSKTPLEIADAGDILQQQIAALHVDPSAIRSGITRAACSPLAVVKKKTRREAPLKQVQESVGTQGVTTEDRKFAARSINDESKILVQPFTPRTVATGATPVHTPEEVSQKVVMARRRLRRSLDRQPPPLDVPKLCDIVVPNSSFYSIPFEVSAGEASAQCSTRLEMEHPRESQSGDIEANEADESVMDSSVQRSFITSFRATYESLDFDSEIIAMPCFQPNENDFDIVKKIKQMALSGTKRYLEEEIARLKNAIANMVEETTQNYPIALECLQNLTPKTSRRDLHLLETARLDAQKEWFVLRNEIVSGAFQKTETSRRDLHVLETARLDAQKEWFVLRNEIVSGAFQKTEVTAFHREILARDSQACKEKMQMLKEMEDYRKAKHDEESIERELANLKEFKSTIASVGKDMETLKAELRDAKGKKTRQYFENMRMEAERLKFLTEVAFNCF